MMRGVGAESVVSVMARPSHDPSCATRRPAVTLAEVAVVLAVMGVLLALAAPRIAGSADRAAVGAAAGELTSLFATARRTAIHRRVPVAVEIDTMRGAVRVVAGGALLLRRDIAGAYGARLSANRDSMAYDPRGLGIGAANLSVIIRRGAAVDTVVVSRLGRVRR